MIFLKNFADKAYSKLKINVVIQDNPLGPLHAFQMSKDFIEKPTLLLLGDTLCDINMDFSQDFLGYKTITDDLHSRWCFIETDSNEKVLQLIDKPEFKPSTDKVLIGLYFFKNFELLKLLLDKQYEKKLNELQLSSLIEPYCDEVPMLGKPIDNWFDTGTLRDYNNTFRSLINGRSMNSFKLNEFGVIEKSSENGKLKSEIEWLMQIEKMPLNIFIPKFLGYEKKENRLTYRTEFVDNQTLAEYLCFYPIAESNWKYIFEKLLKTGQQFWNYTSDITEKEATELSEQMYIKKTIDRIKLWERKDILKHKTIFVNDEELLNFDKCFSILKGRIENLAKSSKEFFTIIHGDMCFSNVLFSPKNANFKLIDPRGNFGKTSIYGDLRYDLAKFRHCYHGLYDYIIAGLYTLEETTSNEFHYNYLTNNITDYAVFDAILKQNGFDVNDVELIEGLLFISMIPLHSDNKRRQVMQYLTGLKCLNNQVKKRGL